MSQVGEYLSTLGDRFGRGWNRFWFAASDPLPLCAIRVVTGILASCWYFGYMLDLERGWFAPDGLFPSDKVREWAGGHGFSYLYYIDNPTTLWIMYWLGGVVLLAFTLGLFTRATSILALVVVLSFMWRAPMLGGPTEEVLAMLMLYLCIGPSGAYLSLDRLLRRKRQTDEDRLSGRTADERLRSHAATVALRLIQVHTVAIYAMMFVAKLRGDVWWSGMAMWWLIAKPDTRLVNLSFLQDTTRVWKEYVINFWTLAIMAFEASFAVLIWNRLARPLLLAISVAVWLSMALITGEVLFSLLMLTAGLAFVSPAWMRRVLSRAEQH